ncbi:MAG TPA: amidohydrolase family protein [bacterium]|nr:amidohydrolase family protein [bacterium]HOL48831.1 amidohydrolase family protein [bacterium]HPQ18952.1 amidohydrolase family protein [bacterium]
MVIDFHTHIFPDKIAEEAIKKLEENTNNQYKAFYNGSLSGLLKSMDYAGIDCAVICSIATKPEQVPKITDWSISIKSNRIFPLGSIHPLYKNVNDELLRLKDNGITGIKLHPLYQNFNIDEELIFSLYEAIIKNNFFILFHSGYDIAYGKMDNASPERIAKIKKKFPELKLVLAHLGGWEDWENVNKYLTSFDDLYFDTSFVFGMINDELFDSIIKKIKIENIFFATDAPWADQKKEKEFIIKYFKENAEKVLYQNAVAFLKMMKYEI